MLACIWVFAVSIPIGYFLIINFFLFPRCLLSCFNSMLLSLFRNDWLIFHIISVFLFSNLGCIFFAILSRPCFNPFIVFATIFLIVFLFICFILYVMVMLICSNLITIISPISFISCLYLITIIHIIVFLISKNLVFMLSIMALHSKFNCFFICCSIIFICLFWVFPTMGSSFSIKSCYLIYHRPHSNCISG